MQLEKWKWVLLYIVSIVVANVITAATHPFKLWIFLIPWGSFFIGATFVLRDFVQRQYDRMFTYKVICAALVFSAIFSKMLGDSLMITVASCIAFAASETSDTEMYTRLSAKFTFAERIWWSGVVGGLIDSALFVVIGLSPLGAGFVPWQFVPMAILGQYIVKVVMQGIGAYVVSRTTLNN
jgi:uncharacterized PurR-regulated membrane protein YhhQ (DUF165 family)